MKKLIAFVLVLVCIFALSGCYGDPEIQIDKIVMRRLANGETTYENVTILDKETISELWAIYDSLETTLITSPLADDRMWVFFYVGDEVEVEWCISAYGNGQHWVNSEFISYSTQWSEGNHSVLSDFDYRRLVEIFNAAKG